MMRALLFGLIFILPPFVKPWVLRRVCGARVGRHVSIGWFASIAAREIELGDYAAVRAATLIRLDGAFRLGRQSEISNFCLIYGASDLEIGDQCYIGPQCLLNCDEPVRMGYYSALGPRSTVFTHGSFLPFTQGYWVKLAGVNIGSYVWCAAGVFLHPGVEIGDECFVNSRSVVTQSIPPGSVVEGNPARIVQPMDAVRRKMSPRRVDAALQQVLRDFARITLEREMGIREIERAPNRLAFTWNGQRYVVAIVPSTTAAAEALPQAAPGEIIVYLANLPEHRPPPDLLWLDATNLRARATNDPVHEALRIFMQRYYGMRFTL
ncbi:MAG TPA: transferase [Chloroflexi bacterium]|nr:transferase [Chloroflexota bacterium]HHW87560.1 acyltransferase [Chloroflexota bacterium]